MFDCELDRLGKEFSELLKLTSYCRNLGSCGSRGSSGEKLRFCIPKVHGSSVGIVLCVLHTLLSAALHSVLATLWWPHEVDNFQSELNGCLSAHCVLQSGLRVSFELDDELAIAFLPPPYLVLGDSNYLGVSRVLPVLS